MRESGALAGAERGLVVTDAPNWLVGKLLASEPAEELRVVAIHRPVAEPLHTLLVAFGIAMFDRFWLQIPTDSGGGV